MTDPKIKVGADVGGVTSGIQRVGQAATEANKQAEKSLARARKELQGYTGDIEKARRAFEALQKSGARGTRNLRGQSFDDYMGGGWKGTSVNDSEARRMHRDITQRVGLGGAAGGGQSALGFGGHSLYTAGRGVMQSAFPVGGVGGNIMQGGYNAARAAPGGLWSGGGMARVAMGAGIGAAAFGAIKGVRSIAGKIGQAEDESSNYADMVRQIGGASSAFGELRDSIRQATAGMGITYNEAAKLGAVYAHEAGVGPKNRRTLAAEVGNAAGFSRGFGLDPEAGVRFFGAMRHKGVTSDGAGDQKLALQIGDAVARKGEFSRVGDLIDAVHGFVTVASRSFVRANTEGFLGMTSKLGGLGLTGLGLAESAGLAGKLDAGFRSPGGGEAGQNMMLAMMQRLSPDLTAMDLAAVQGGGMYALGSDVFGRKSAQYGLASKKGDTAEMARLDRISGALGSSTMGDQLFKSLHGLGLGTQALISSASTMFNVNSSESAAALTASLASGGSSKLSSRLARLGVNTASINPSNFGLLAAMEGGGRSTIAAQGRDLLGRSGADKLSGVDGDRMKQLLDGGDTEALRDHVMKLSATRGNQTEGDLNRQSIAGLNNTFESFATNAIPLLTKIRDATVSIAEINPFSGVSFGTLDKMRADEARAVAPGFGGAAGAAAAGAFDSTSFRNPKYDAIEKVMEKRLGLSPGLLAGIRLNGERTDSDKVSSAGARSVYQITPTSRDVWLKRTGVDAFAGDSEAAAVAAMILKENLARSKGDEEQAVREYVGGTNPKNWGSVTNAYVGRVMGGRRNGSRGGDMITDPSAADGTVPMGAGSNYGNEGRNHQTATVILLGANGKPAAAPITFNFSSEPVPAGAR